MEHGATYSVFAKKNIKKKKFIGLWKIKEAAAWNRLCVVRLLLTPWSGKVETRDGQRNLQVLSFIILTPLLFLWC